MRALRERNARNAGCQCGGVGHGGHDPALFAGWGSDGARAAGRATSFLADQELDTDAFMRRFLAFRQYVEMTRSKYETTKTARAKPWRMRIRRTNVCHDVIEHFGDSAKMRLFQMTEVTFIDAETHEQEEGNDEDGLTAEMYFSFFRQVLRTDAGFFESAEGCVSGELLPAVSASADHMAAIGRIICKCVLDDHPLGRGRCLDSTNSPSRRVTWVRSLFRVCAIA